jgi:hypothetical protein
MAIKLILLLLTFLLSANSALAQAKVGGRTIPQFLLTIGDSVFPLGADPPLEHTQGQISFTLNVDIFSDIVPQTVMVCTPIGEGCAILSNFGPHTVLTGVVWVNFPSVGATVQMTVCEDVKRGVNICGKTLSTAQKIVSLSASYAFVLTNVTVFHTRAHTTDTAYVSVMGGPLISTISKSNCEGNNQALLLPNLCSTVSVGNFQDGDHEVKPPILMSSCNVTNAVTSACKFALAVWNFGFELVSDSGDLQGALFSAAIPLLTSNSSSPGVVDITHALNDHAWEGCDGPTLGKVFTMTGAQLDQLTRATGNSSQSVERSKVRSQVGCGASSDYSATFSIVRDSWKPLAN